MAVLYTNNAVATLAASITNTATSISLTAGQGGLFPNPTGGDIFYATLTDTAGNLEIVRCTARSTDTLTVVRGQEGTTARAYTAGDKLELRVTAAGLDNKLDKDTGGTIAGAITVQSDSAFTSTGGLGMPSGTTAQRGSPTRPTIRYNSEQATWEGFNGSTWGAIGGGGTPVRQQFTATAGQTTFAISGGYTPNQVDVFMNGVKLVNGTDVTVSSGTNVVLTSGAAAGDIIDVVGITSYSIASVVAKSGDTMTGFLTLHADPTNALHAATKQYADTKVSLTGNETIAGNKTFSGSITASATGANTQTTRFTTGVSDPNFFVGTLNGVAGSTTGTSQAKFGLFYSGVGECATIDFIRGGSTTDGSFAFRTDGVNRATLDNSGNFTATGNVTAYSDERLKAGWIQVQNDFVAKLAGVKAGSYFRTDTQETQDGVSAQSLQDVMPNSVKHNTDGYLSVAYGNAALVAAVELAKEVVELKKRLEVLEAK